MAAEDEIARLAARMGITTAAAEDLIRSLRNASNSMDRNVSATDANRSATDRMSQSARENAAAQDQLKNSVKNTAKSFLTMPFQIGKTNSVFTSVEGALDSLIGVIDDPDIRKAIEKTFSATGGLVGSIAGPMGRVAGMVGGKLIGQLTGNFASLSAKAAKVMLAGAEEVVQSYFTLSESGVTFAGSLARLNDLTRETGFSLQFMSKFASENAQNLASFGGTVEGSMKNILKTVGDLDDQLVTVYGGFNNLSSAVVDYMNLQRLQGLDNIATSKTLKEDTSNYLYNLKLLSTLTGKNAKQINESIAQQTRNAAAQSMLRNMSTKERGNYLKQLGLLNDEKLKSLYAEYVLTRKFGTVMSTTNRMLMSQIPGIESRFSDMYEDISMNDDVSMQKTANNIKMLGETVKNESDQLAPLFALVETGYVQILKPTADFAASMGESKKYTDALPGALKVASESIETLRGNVKEVQALTSTVGGILRYQQTIQNAINQFFIGDDIIDGKRVEGGRIATVGAMNMLLQRLSLTILEYLEKVLSNTLKYASLGVTGAAKKFIQDSLADTPFDRRNATEILTAGEQELVRMQNQIKLLENSLRRPKPVEEIENLKTQETELKNELDKIRERMNNQQPPASAPSSESDRGVDVGATSSLNLSLGSKLTPLEIDIEPLEEVFADLNQTNRNLEIALNRQTDQFRRLLDRLG